MGNTQSGNSNVNLYEQYLNETKRIIAAQQEQINNLTRMNLQNNSVQHKHAIPTNIYVQSIPIRNPQNTYTGDSRQQQFPQIENKTPVASGSRDKLNPYKILGISKKFDEKIFKKSIFKLKSISNTSR